MPKHPASRPPTRRRRIKFIEHRIDDSDDDESTTSTAVTSSYKHTVFSTVKRGRKSSRNLSRYNHYGTLQISPTKPDKQPVEPLSENWQDPDIFVAEPGYDGDEEESYHHYLEATEGERRMRSRTIVRPMDTWREYRDQYLDELLRLDGRCDAANQSTCIACNKSPSTYRCRDCYGLQMYCRECLIIRHALLPLHRPEKWNGFHFERCNLKSLRLRVQLGHDGGPCAHPRPGPEDFIVIGMNGIHEVAVDFCGCDRIQPPHIQLLRAEWYPATIPRPKTCATFKVLEHFHLESFESKVSAYEYYQTLTRLSDNSGTQQLKDRYVSFVRMEREWRNLKILKRFGRGHDSGGVLGTQEGDCAVVCPACPIPRVNIPDNWDLAPEKDRWLYALILAVDANFRQKNKARANAAADPALGSGWAYFVEEEKYKEHLSCYGSQKDISTCSKHAAISQANKETRGLSTTGVGAAVCARHQFMRANGVVDLQKGERYCNMDYAVFSTLRHNPQLKRLVISYDINCQWSKHVWERMQGLPREFKLQLGTFLFTPVIPKFHLPAHQEDCQATYSFNLAVGVGNTDGEGIERNWQVINPLGPSTQEMGAGSRHDTLDDHYGDLNWRKTVGIGRALNDRLENAVPERNLQLKNFRSMSANIPESQLIEWTKMVEIWEKDHSAPNPYEIPRTGMTQAQVREQLAAAEEHDATNGTEVTHEVSPSAFLTIGLRLEHQQRQLAVDVRSTKTGTSGQMADLYSRRALLRRRINAWIEIQAIYMPVVPQLRMDHDRAASSFDEHDHAEVIKLWLPSALSYSQRTQGCHPDLVDNEWQLRRGQAYDALAAVRHHLRHLAYLHKFKLVHVRGQGPNTKVRSLIDNTCKLRDAAVMTYRHAYDAMIRLDPTRDSWQRQLQKLNNGDIRYLGQGAYDDPDAGRKRRRPTGKSKATGNSWVGEVGGCEDLDPIPADEGLSGAAQPMNDQVRPSESRRTVSWIWAAVGVGEGDDGQDPGLTDALRVEWAKSRARAQRWEEEVVLLQEEMRRVKAYFTWRETWWLERCSRRKVGDTQLLEGIGAYAAKQARIQRALLERFSEMWAPTIVWATEQLAIGDTGGQFEAQRDRPGRPKSIVDPGESDGDGDANFAWSD